MVLEVTTSCSCAIFTASALLSAQANNILSLFHSEYCIIFNQTVSCDVSVLELKDNNFHRCLHHSYTYIILLFLVRALKVITCTSGCPPSLDHLVLCMKVASFSLTSILLQITHSNLQR